MATVAETKEKVQRFLTQLGSVTIDEHGRYSARQGSARVFVDVDELGEDQTWVSIVCPLLWDVPISPELYEHIALHSDQYRYGTLNAAIDSDDATKVNLFFTYGMLGTTLDPDEMKLAMALLAETADDLDDELSSRFGGRRFHEE